MMNESFVLHAEFIEDLPLEYRERFLLYTYNYGIHGDIPDVDGLEKSLWIKIQKRIDADKESYQKKLEYQRQYQKNKKLRKLEENNKTLQSLQTFESFENKKNIYPNSRSDIEFDIESDIDIEFVNDIDIDNDASKKLDASYPSLKDYSNKIFNLYKDAGLPCNRNNSISFLQMDFNNAMRYIHNSPELKGLHSDDVIGAVKNYISCLSDKNKFIKNKMNFYSLVKSKIFYELLPQNYNDDSFKRFDAPAKEEQQEIRTFIPDLCPSCNKSNVMYWDKSKDKYICNSCSNEFSFSEIMGKYVTTTSI